MFGRARFTTSLLAMVAGFAMGCGDAETTNPLPPPNTDPAHLEPPPAGQGFQITTDETIVDAGNEVQDCYFYKISDLLAEAGMPADEVFNLHRVQIGQRPGSHHMNVFKIKTVV